MFNFCLFKLKAETECNWAEGLFDPAGCLNDTVVSYKHDNLDSKKHQQQKQIFKSFMSIGFQLKSAESLLWKFNQTWYI